MTSSIYYGFSSRNNPDTINTACFGITLVQRDLQNEFDTDFGERVRRGKTFGTIIRSLWMDPNTDNNAQQIYNDVARIIAADPRVSLLQMSMQTPNDYTVIVSALCQMVEFPMTDPTWLNFTFTFGTD